MSLADWKALLEAAESGATVVALLVGGLWTYRLFVKNRERFPRAAVSHKAAVLNVSADKWLVQVESTVKNSGEVLLSLDAAWVRLQQVLPLPSAVGRRLASGQDPVLEEEQEVRWPVLVRRDWRWQPGSAEIEPGEEETLLADFFVDKTVEVVEVYTYVKNTSKRQRTIGWARTTLLRLCPPGPVGDAFGAGSGPDDAVNVGLAVAGPAEETEEQLPPKP